MAETSTMKKILTLLFTLHVFASQAQVEVDSTRYDEVRSMVNFYQYILNTVGHADTPTRDKEVIIKESFKKIFEGPSVQIEDDLSADRKVITNKDVNAYLRDVDFFFKTVRFDFEDVKIETLYREDSSTFFMVTFESIINGETIDDQIYQRSKTRFLEINLNAEEQDLKIASVYSTKISREEELDSWWENLSYGWKNIFSSLVPFDTISTAILMKMVALDSIQISESELITDLEPLDAFKHLSYLDISRTNIADLTQLRHANRLQTLNASGTPIQDLTALQFCNQLERLDISDTDVTDINALATLKNLVYLNVSESEVADFSALKELKNLVNINLSNTGFDDPTLLANSVQLSSVNLARTPVDHLFVFQSLPKVETLDISESNVVNLNGLENHPSLAILNINQTSVESLRQLNGSASLNKIYADLSGVTDEKAAAFMADNPGTVVVTNSAQLINWWGELDVTWQTVLSAYMNNNTPGKEDLVRLINIDSLNVAGKNLFVTAPLKRFRRLKYLDVSDNDITEFDFTSEMSDLKQLIATNLPLTHTEGLENNTNLNLLNVTDSKLNDISALWRLRKLTLLYADDTFLDENQIINHLDKNPNTTIVYQTTRLQKWWEGLNTAWKYAFELAEPGTEALHRLTQQSTILIENQPVVSLKPLDAFVNLKVIRLDRVRATQLNELFIHEQLESLSFTNSPLQNLDGVERFKQLKALDISGTAIEDLKALYKVQTLRHLRCSGTGIKNLKGLDDLVNMESLDVSNTRIWRLDRLLSMSGIQSLTCYNTRLSQAKIDAFKVKFPNCSINFY